MKKISLTQMSIIEGKYARCYFNPPAYALGLVAFTIGLGTSQLINAVSTSNWCWNH